MVCSPCPKGIPSGEGSKDPATSEGRRLRFGCLIHIFTRSHYKNSVKCHNERNEAEWMPLAFAALSMTVICAFSIETVIEITSK